MYLRFRKRAVVPLIMLTLASALWSIFAGAADIGGAPLLAAAYGHPVDVQRNHPDSLRSKEALRHTTEPKVAIAAQPKFVTGHDFETEVVQASLNSPVFVVFVAKWCGLCRSYQSLLMQEDDIKSDKMKLLYVDIDTEPELVSRSQINAIPTTSVWDHGKFVQRINGSLTSFQLSKVIGSLNSGWILDFTNLE